MSRKKLETPADGSLQALDHAANWVRFADTKATVLTAAFGVVTTMFIADFPSVIEATRSSEEVATRLGAIAALVGASFLFTLGWLVRAITPRAGAQKRLNRFSWPALSSADLDALREHIDRTPVHEDAWRQTLVLAGVAEAKFRACRYAATGFALFISSAVACVVTASLINQ